MAASVGRRRAGATAIALLAFVTLDAQGEFAQVQFRVEGSDPVGSEARTYRLYENPSEIHLAFTVGGQITSPYSIQYGAVVENVQFIVALEGRELPTIAEWSQNVKLAGSRTAVAVARHEDVVVEPGSSPEWSLSLLREDRQPFATGRYAIRVVIDGMVRAAHTADGEPWRGRFAPARGSVFLVLGPPAPAVPREQAAAYLQRGRAALDKGRPQDAMMSFQEALAADPTSLLAQIAAGRQYLRLNRFADAIAPLEQAVSTQQRVLQRSGLSRELALAYVGVNDEQNAARVLRASGVTEQRIPTDIQQLRAEVLQRAR